MLLTQERKGPGQTLLSSGQFPKESPEFEVRVLLQDTVINKLYRNVTHVYMAENAYVIIRADKSIFTFCMDTARLEIN